MSFFCAGCSTHYRTEKEVTKCSADHAKKRQEENQRVEQEQRQRAQNQNK